MARFAPVVPLSLAALLKERGALGSYHLLLAHDVLENPKVYREIYSNQGFDIIMDNSLIELGYPLPVNEVLEAAEIVGAQKFVLPDTLGNYTATKEQVEEGIGEWQAIKNNFSINCTPLAVVQGSTWHECIRCLLDYKEWDLSISIPRVLTEVLKSRIPLALKAAEMGFQNIHLLGFSEDILDDLACARMTGVAGIDSAVPVRAGVACLPMEILPSSEWKKKVGPRGNFWDIKAEILTEEEKDMVCRNVLYVNSRL